MKKEITIWSSEPDYESYKDILAEDLPNLSEEERKEFLRKANNEGLYFQKEEMSLNLGNPILVMEERGKTYLPFKTIASGNLADCFEAPEKNQKLRYFLNEEGDLFCEKDEKRYLYRLLGNNTGKTHSLGYALSNIYGILLD